MKAILVLCFFLLLSFTLFARAYNSNWGALYYFHPDERNIASAISQLQIGSNMNPHFFAYGSFPLYTIYFTGVLLNSLSRAQEAQHVSFQQAILLSRMYALFFSVLLLPLIFFATRKIANTQSAILALFLSATSVGFAQYAHFGTFEMWLTFFGFLLWYCCVVVIRKISIFAVALLGVLMGILLAIKVSSIALAPAVFLALLLGTAEKHHRRKRGILFFLFYSALTAGMGVSVFFLTSPYTLFDTSSFLNSLRYESAVALGLLEVFYTGSFTDTTPILFHFTKVFPFLVNPIITMLFPLSFYLVFRHRKFFTKEFLMLLLFLLLFLSQSFFFVKWTRYMVPTLPFIYIGTAVFLTIHSKNRWKKLLNIGVAVISFLYFFSYFITVPLRNDTRIDAFLWAKEHVPANATILSESFDLGITPFNTYFQNISLFNFYELDINKSERELVSLRIAVENTDYIVLPSQRIVKSRIEQPQKFPEGNAFYKALFTETNRYKKLYQTPCDFFCSLLYLGDPIYKPEETTAVFDRPTVFIFKVIH